MIAPVTATREPAPALSRGLLPVRWREVPGQARDATSLLPVAHKNPAPASRRGLDRPRPPATSGDILRRSVNWSILPTR
jgi:hypothetical protein